MKNYLPYDAASAIAAELLALLRPACERIEIAGSLRRQCPTVGDLELVAISRTQFETNLLGEPVAERPAIFDVLQQPDPRITARYHAGLRHRQFTFTGFPVDLFVIEPATWGVIYTLRTGNAIFSHWTVSQRRIHGGLPDHLYVKDGRVHNQDTGFVLATPEEDDFLTLLRLPAGLPPDNPLRNARDWAEIARIRTAMPKEG